MTIRTLGIHHITAFVRDPQRNVDFYASVLGLRLVKQTINYDLPEVYHLYFGNEQASPGTIITFFPFEHGRKGKLGAGQVGVTTYIIPIGAYNFWKERLQRFHIEFEEKERFQERYLQFWDPDGLRLEIVEREDGKENTWSFAGVSANVAIKGFGGAILFSTHPEATGETLENIMGLTYIGEDVGYRRYKACGELGNIIDVNIHEMERGHGGAGTVHHIAWRADDRDELEMWSNQVSSANFKPTEIKNRNYFSAIYFREKGGILYEIATDTPGFTIDEPLEQLGEQLQLPQWYEHLRPTLQQKLTPFQIRTLEE